MAFLSLVARVSATFPRRLTLRFRKKRTFEECSPVCSEGFCQLCPESLFVAWRYQRYGSKVGAGIRETHCPPFNIYPVCSRQQGYRIGCAHNICIR